MKGEKVLREAIKKRERLNVGTVPTVKMHPVGTVPTVKMHPIGTVPTAKMQPVGTFPAIKMHLGGAVPVSLALWLNALLRNFP